jgi:hypothetical protein
MLDVLARQGVESHHGDRSRETCRRARFGLIGEDTVERWPCLGAEVAVLAQESPLFPS